MKFVAVTAKGPTLYVELSLCSLPTVNKAGDSLSLAR